MAYRLKYLFDDYDNFTSDMSWEDYDEADAYRQRAYSRFKPEVNVVILVHGEAEDEEEFINMLGLEDE